jgi:superfamily II DNA or RNA helicase
MEIKILDPVYSLLTDKKYIPMVSKLLSFQAEFWMKMSIKDKNGIPTGRFKRERKTYPKSIVLPSGMFFTGHVPKVVEYLTGKGLAPTVSAQKWPFFAQSPQTLIPLRPDQTKLVLNAVDKHRGIIKAPTGFGKTFLAGSIISCVEGIRAVFLCHTKTLVHQTIKEFEKLGLDVGYITGTSKKLDGGVIVATVQSFHKQPQEFFNSFDMVIVDEAHHLAKIGGLYFRTLTKLIAPYRYGLTATLPTGEETKLLVEGLLGGLIDEYSLKEGTDRGILAVPKIKIVKIPVDYKVKELRKYQDVYNQGVVNNRSRNRMIIKIAKDLAVEGKTTLILITKIEHGEVLSETAKLLGHSVCFIQGRDDGEMREMVRGSLNTKEIKTVIATQIWKEGVDVPSLDCIINAAGGKSEIAVLQGIGRGLRATKDKDTVLIVDFLDLSHYYLISHLGERLAIYSENNWL